MERFGFGKMKWALGMFVLGSCLKLSAQSSVVSTDSISVFTLMEQVEKKTSCKIYTDMSKPFKVKKQVGNATLEQLEKALEGTGWKVNKHGNQVFVMRNLELYTYLPKSWTEETDEQKQTIKLTEVLTSENKVYEIGDKYNPSLKKKIKLRRNFQSSTSSSKYSASY